jgi:RHS repeat-associated protein
MKDRGEPLSQIQGGNTYWYVLDALGNVVGLVNNSNTLVAKYVYDAWGTEASTSFDNLTVKNPLRYRGSQGYLHLYGPDACRGWSLYLAGARVYHTGVGRWLSEDPLLGNPGDPMSFNRYLYTNANPVDYSDPSGLVLPPPRKCKAPELYEGMGVALIEGLGGIGMLLAAPSVVGVGTVGSVAGFEWWWWTVPNPYADGMKGSDYVWSWYYGSFCIMKERIVNWEPSSGPDPRPAGAIQPATLAGHTQYAL